MTTIWPQAQCFLHQTFTFELLLVSFTSQVHYTSLNPFFVTHSKPVFVRCRWKELAACSYLTAASTPWPSTYIKKRILTVKSKEVVWVCCLMLCHMFWSAPFTLLKLLCCKVNSQNSRQASVTQRISQNDHHNYSWWSQHVILP